MSNRSKIPTFDELSVILHYEPKSGRLSWKHGKQGRNINKIAGHISPSGYRKLTINGTVYTEHLIAWVLNTGDYPIKKLYHLNGVKVDNRFENLALKDKPLTKKRVELTQTRLEETLSYDMHTGLFTRLNKIQTPVGKNTDKDGYLSITVDGVSYRAHRLDWLYVYGEFPKGLIDHINGVADDNRITNLRVVDDAQNLKNQKIRSNNKSGFKGVSWSNQRQQWRARCCANYVDTHLGYFNTPEEASIAYNEFAKIAHGKFYRDTTK